MSLIYWTSTSSVCLKIVGLGFSCARVPGEVTAITQVAALSAKGKFHLNCQSLAVRVRALWSLPGASPVARRQAIRHPFQAVLLGGCPR